MGPGSDPPTNGHLSEDHKGWFCMSIIIAFGAGVIVGAGWTGIGAIFGLIVIIFGLALWAGYYIVQIAELVAFIGSGFGAGGLYPMTPDGYPVGFEPGSLLWLINLNFIYDNAASAPRLIYDTLYINPPIQEYTPVLYAAPP